MPVATLNHVQINYRLEGRPELPVIVLVHPIASDLSFWDKQVDVLTATHRVLRVDLRGHGATTASPGEYTVDMHAADILALLDSLKIDSFALCGLSLGGMVSTAIAAKAGKRVTHLIVANASPRLSPPPDGWDTRIAAVLANGMAPMVTPMSERLFGEEYRKRDEPFFQTQKAVMALMDPKGYAANVAILRDGDLREVAKSVTAKTLVIAGAADKVVPASYTDLFASVLPGAKLVSIDAGHMSAVENPKDFNAALQAFLKA